MKRLIKLFAELIGRSLAVFFHESMGEMFRAFVSHVYTGFFSKKFAYFGKGSVIGYKATSLKGLGYIHVGENVELDKGIVLTAWDSYMGERTSPEIRIGDNCHIGAMSHITSCNSISLGKNLLTGTNVLITDNSHGGFDMVSLTIHPQKRRLVSKGGVVIGDNVWLGNNVCVMPGVTIGDGVIVGANSVVTKDLPPFSVAAGAPAKVIKQIGKENGK